MSNRIPLTTYTIIVKHPSYHDVIVDVELGVNGTPEFREYNINMTPIDYCQNDCTFIGDSNQLCRKECNGINGCQFKNISSLHDSNYAANLLHLVPKKPAGQYIEISVDGSRYKVNPCEGDWYYLTADDKKTVSSQCPDGKEAWKVTQPVKLNGKIVRMVLTICQ